MKQPEDLKGEKKAYFVATHTHAILLPTGCFINIHPLSQEEGWVEKMCVASHKFVLAMEKKKKKKVSQFGSYPG